MFSGGKDTNVAKDKPLIVTEQMAHVINVYAGKEILTPDDIGKVVIATPDGKINIAPPEDEYSCRGPLPGERNKAPAKKPFSLGINSEVRFGGLLSDRDVEEKHIYPNGMINKFTTHLRCADETIYPSLFGFAGTKRANERRSPDVEEKFITRIDPAEAWVISAALLNSDQVSSQTGSKGDFKKAQELRECMFEKCRVVSNEFGEQRQKRIETPNTAFTSGGVFSLGAPKGLIWGDPHVDLMEKGLDMSNIWTR